MKKQVQILLGVVVAVFALVALFTMFADSFQDIGNVAAGRPNVMLLAFQAEEHGYNDMPAFIVAFSFLIAAAVFALVGAFLPGKLSLAVYALNFALLVACAAIFFLGKTIFVNAGTLDGQPINQVDQLVLGPGFLCPAIFSTLGALLCLYGGYRTFKGN